MKRMTLGGIALALLIAFHTPPATAAGSPQWMPQPPLRLARAGLGVVAVNGAILAIGGFNPPEVFGNVEALRLTGSGPWQPAAPLPTARVNLGTALLDGRSWRRSTPQPGGGHRAFRYPNRAAGSGRRR